MVLITSEAQISENFHIDIALVNCEKSAKIQNIKIYHHLFLYMGSEREQRSEFYQLLTSISSEIGLKILYLYNNNPEGLNLTDTARQINENTSTVRDHLKRLFDAKLIYKMEKNYLLSNFGSYILFNLDQLETFNKTRLIFGEIPAELIPSKFLQELIPHIKDIEIVSDQWKFMLESGRILTQIQTDLGRKHIDLRVLGWKSLTLSMGIIQNYFKDISLDKKSLQKFLEDTNFQLISDEDIIKEVKKNDQLRQIMDLVNIKERIFICKDFQLKFTLFKYNSIIQLFLNEEEKAGLGHYFTIENNDKAVEFFNNVFEYYKNKATPLSRIM